MSENPYYYSKINGKQVANDPHSVLLGTAADDIIYGDAFAALEAYGFAPQRIAGLQGDDLFEGNAGRFYGGAGDDVFVNNGVHIGYDTYDKAALAFGGLGNDTFYDYYGSTDYYGGRGSDHFYSTIHTFDGDLDRVWLGRGNDKANVDFSHVSSASGLHPDGHSFFVQGGPGNDTLSLGASLGGAPLQGDADGVLDLRGAIHGEMQVNSATVAGFENFEVYFRSSHLHKLITGSGNDRVQYLGDNDWRTVKMTTLLGAGNDYYIGAHSNQTERVAGGPGNDVLISFGASQGMHDHLFGGKGMDFLFVEGSSYHGTIMKGGPGADTFVLATDVEVRDFHPGKDHVAMELDPDMWNYSYDKRPVELLHLLHSFTDAMVKQDDDTAIVLQLPDDPYLTYARGDLRYDQQTGDFQLRDEPGHDWHFYCHLDGAPHLSVDDFAYFGYF
ncbi:hypothetical protein [Acidimangrovimonas pyrenivorans]|uniref:Calcium-binding protein n=1 Tax=Acidimangrovimonas pyrenivorans TaxID=2030798 RepID=A0ABV7AJ28_9RHOB